VRRTLSGGRRNSKTEAELSTLARPEAFDDGAALFEVVCGRELEGIVAKHVGERYRAPANEVRRISRTGLLAVRARTRVSDKQEASTHVRLRRFLFPALGRSVPAALGHGPLVPGRCLPALLRSLVLRTACLPAQTTPGWRGRLLVGWQYLTCTVDTGRGAFGPLGGEWHGSSMPLRLSDSSCHPVSL
jgi:hypothetical protein